MRYSFLLLILCAISFVACDGRKSQSESLREAVEEFKDSVGPIEVIKYSPENYYYTEVDTVLTSGFSCFMKLYIDMENSILNEETIDSIIYKTYYRDIKADINVQFKNETLFSGTIDKSFFINNDKDFAEILKDKNLYNVYLNEPLLNDEKNEIRIVFQFYNPVTKKEHLFYRIEFNRNKKYSIIDVTEDELNTY